MKKFLKNSALLLVLLGVIVYVVKSWDFSALNGLKPNWFLLIISVLLLVLHFILVAVLSFFVLTPARHLSLNRYFDVYFITQLGRYIPGKIWLVVGKMEMLKNEGFSRTWIAGASFFEMFLMIVGAGIVSIFSTIQGNAIAGFSEYRWLLYLFIGLSISFIVFFHYFWSVVVTLIERFLPNLNLGEFKQTPYSRIYLFFLVSGYMLSWIIQGVAFSLLIKALIPEYQNIFYFVITYAFSWIVGFLSLFAPSGLGVKESMIILLLNQVMKPTESILIAITARIWSSGVEIVLMAIFSVRTMLSRRQPW